MRWKIGNLKPQRFQRSDKQQSVEIIHGTVQVFCISDNKLH